VGIVFVFYHISRLLNYSQRTTLTAAILLGAGTMLWPYSHTPLSDTTLAFCFTAATYGLLVYRQNASSKGLLLTGVTLAIAVLCKVSSIAFLPVFAMLWYVSTPDGLGYISRHTCKRVAAYVATPLLIAGLIVLWYNNLRYGSPWTSGYHTDRNAGYGFNTPFLTGLYGLILSTGKGFVFYNPVAILGIVGFPAFLKRHRLVGWLVMSLTIVFLLLFSPWWAWHGDWSWGPRFLVPVAPLLMLPTLPILERICHAKCINGQCVWRVSIYAVIIVSLGV
jgi:4-amino-4-deoxy-L-arabinose transferase-like glycosyltransferase